MAKRRKTLATNRLDDGVFLLLSTASGTLFAFGLLNYMNDLNYPSYVPVIVGASLTMILLLFRRYTNENNILLGKKPLGKR